MKKLLAVGALIGAAAAATLVIAGDSGTSGKALTPEEALAAADSSEVVTVQGRLRNAGSNYFTDRRLVLTGMDKDAEINVQAWLPATASLPRSAGAPRAEVQSDYLDKEVVLTGQLKVRPVKGVGVTKVLVVKEAVVTK